MQFLRFSLAVLALASPDTAAQPGPSPAPFEKRTYREVDGGKLELWIWKPADWRPDDRRSAILLFHGGGFRGGSPAQFTRHGARLAHRGMVAISAEYTFIAPPRITIVESVKDARAAMRWLRTNAANLGIDPGKIAAGGGSSGAFLSAALASLHEFNHPTDDLGISTRPAALVLWSAVLRQPQANLSPFQHIAAGHPPTISFHGEADTNIPIRAVREYAAKVKEAGGEFNVIGFDGADHFFSGVDATIPLKHAETFLEKHGLLRPGFNDDPMPPGPPPYVSARTDAPISREQLAEYVGYYRIDEKRKFTVAVDEDDRLRIRLTGQTFGPPVLLHGGDDLFFARSFAAEFQFGRGAGGKVDYLALHQNGVALPARRIAAALPSVQFLAPEKLKEYAGNYQMEDARTLHITVRAGHLFAQLTGQPALPLFCERTDHFVHEAVDASLTFVRNTSGGITGLVRDQDGSSHRASRVRDQP